MTAPTTPLNIHILAFDEVEALDLAGPYEVFTTAARVAARLASGANAPAGLASAARWQVRCVSRDGGPVRARAGLRILPEAAFATAGPCDLLVVPGGVVDGPLACPDTLAWVRETAARCPITASVCTGVFVLAAAGVVHTHRVTTHWEDVADLRQRWPHLQVDPDARWVDEGTVVSSAGISAGIDMSLHLVERFAGQALAERTARQMDYRWQREAA